MHDDPEPPLPTDATPRMDPNERDALVRAIERPDKNLLILFVLQSLLLGPFFFIPILPMYFRYQTLRYGFGDDGISVSWGILFRRETHLTYRRVQDIHVTRNIIERWLGIATVSVQTASGSGDAEAQIAGVRDFDAIRDYLYARMRGLEASDDADEDLTEADVGDEATALLTEIRDTLRMLAEQAKPAPAVAEPVVEVVSVDDSAGAPEDGEAPEAAGVAPELEEAAPAEHAHSPTAEAPTPDAPAPDSASTPPPADEPPRA